MVKLLDTLPDRIDPAHTAMLVVDVQNDFCAPGGYIDAVMGRDVSGCVPVADGHRGTPGRGARARAFG